jgi:hypothetical protein
MTLRVKGRRHELVLLPSAKHGVHINSSGKNYENIYANSLTNNLSALTDKSRMQVDIKHLRLYQLLGCTVNFW